MRSSFPVSFRPCLIFVLRFSTLPVVGSWVPTLGNAGIPKCGDPLSGEPFGAFITTSAINPANWTRSEARNSYIDPLPPRQNLHILTNATVTRIVFDSSNPNNLTATSVEYAFVKGGSRSSIRVRKEVILSAGSIGSPHVLFHSGVGPSDVLSSVGIDVKLNLPGVGQHLQDHVVSFSAIRPPPNSVRLIPAFRSVLAWFGQLLRIPLARFSEMVLEATSLMDNLRHSFPTSTRPLLTSTSQRCWEVQDQPTTSRTKSPRRSIALPTTCAPARTRASSTATRPSIEPSRRSSC